MLYDKERIKQLQQAKDLSGNALAKLAGVSGPSMHDILNGKTKIVRAKTWFNLAAALGVHPREIIKLGKGSEEPEKMLLDLLLVLDKKDKEVLLGTAQVLAQQHKK